MLEKQILTPALVLDLDVMKANMETAQTLLDKAGLKLRPHYKSHKCPAIAHMQIEAGAIGMTCAKLEEAEDLVECGIENVLIGNQVTDRAKMGTLMRLAGCCHLTVCVDSQENVRDLETAAAFQDVTLHTYVEYDIGMERCGTRTFEEFLALAKFIQQQPHLTFDGIQAYAGQLAHERSMDVQEQENARIEKELTELKAYLEENGVAVKEVSGISTGTIRYKPEGSVYTEAQMGSYIMMDTAYSYIHTYFQPSLFLLTQVISKAGNLIITDAGAKEFGMDQTLPVFADCPEVPINFSEEHSAIPGDSLSVEVGDKLRMIPGHCCTTMNIHNYVYLVQNGKVVDRLHIDGRNRCR